MDRDRDKMVEKILHLTLEILFRLTGEDYTVVKKTSSERCQAPVFEGWGRPLSPIMGPPPHHLNHEDINDQEILELTNKMIELLTGEVPIRYQDVTVYFSMEEWEYFEEHKDLYKDVMTKIPQPLTSPVLSSKRTTPERCPRTLLQQDCKQENPDVPQHHQGEDLTHINTTETYGRGDERSKKEIPTDNRPDDCTGKSEGQLISALFTLDDVHFTQETSQVYPIILDLPSSLHCTHLSSDSSQTIKKHKSHERDAENQTALLEKKPFSYSEYGKAFSLNTSFITHQKVDTEEKRFSCLECGIYFNPISEFADHEKTHTEEKTYSCSERGKCFVDRSNLQISHTREKLFSCFDCGKCFNLKTHLVRHLKTHTGEKPFSCSECGCCFSEKSNLNVGNVLPTNHIFFDIKELTGEKPFSYVGDDVLLEILEHGGGWSPAVPTDNTQRGAGDKDLGDVDMEWGSDGYERVKGRVEGGMETLEEAEENRNEAIQSAGVAQPPRYSSSAGGHPKFPPGPTNMETIRKKAPENATTGPPPSQPTSPPAEWWEFVRQLPTKRDFQALISEVKDTCRSEIAAVRQDVVSISKRINQVENDHNEARTTILHLQSQTSSQAEVIRELPRHIEDLDNRGRRHNIRVRGVLEAQAKEDVTTILQTIFNSLLQRPPDNPIPIDRAHRALRPKNLKGNPKDIICHIIDFQLKEEIMLKARPPKQVIYRGIKIQLFHDLSWIMLQQRKALRPLLSSLKANNIFYRWGFRLASLHGEERRRPAFGPPQIWSNFVGRIDYFFGNVLTLRTLQQPQIGSITWSDHAPLLIYLSSKLKKDSQQLYRQCEIDLRSAEQQFRAHPTKSSLKKVIDLRTKLKEISHGKIEKLLRYSRQKYYEYGNKPHTMLARKLRDQTINSAPCAIKDTSGTPHYDPTKIAQLFHTYYTFLYSIPPSLSMSHPDRTKIVNDYLTDCHLPKLSQEALDDLNREILPDEIHQIIKDLPNHKASGPDEFTYLYYKTFVGELSSHLTHVFNLFMKGEDIPNTFLHSYITIIPKADIIFSLRSFKLLFAIMNQDIEFAICGAAIAVAASTAVIECNRTNRRNARFGRIWAREWLLERDRFSHLNLLRELQERHPNDFQNYLRMSENSFKFLLQRVEHQISRQNTVMRAAVTSVERLSVTLRFLATGRTLTDLQYSSAISLSALSSIIPDTCQAIIDNLADNNPINVDMAENDDETLMNPDVLIDQNGSPAVDSLVSESDANVGFGSGWAISPSNSDHGSYETVQIGKAGEGRASGSSTALDVDGVFTRIFIPTTLVTELVFVDIFHIFFMIAPSSMDEYRDKIAQRILQLTLEILFRLTGEDYTVVKKTSSEHYLDPVSEGWGRSLIPIIGPSPHPQRHEDINDQKILELTYKMIELLIGEVPIRCHDVAVYFSMDEWEYLEGHQDLYKEIMMEDPKSLTSPVLFSERAKPERCPHPLLPQDCKQEDPNVPQDYQAEDLTHINTTETYVRGDEWCKGEIPTDNRPGDCTRISEGQLTSAIFISDDFDFKQEITEVKDIILDTPTSLHIKDLSSDVFKQVFFSNSSQTIEKNISHKRGIENQSSVTANNQFTSVDYGNSLSLKMSFVTDQTFHTDKKRFSSSQCGKYFNQKSEHARRDRVYSGEKPHSCSECVKCFVNKSSLVTHQRSHTGEKPYLCSECGKCFADKSHFVRHHKLHTGEKPFSCSECGKSFVDKSTLVIHQRIHTGNKPYSCSECGKCFVDKATLIIHQRTHTGEKPHSCSECGKCFADKSNLVKHEKIHRGEKASSCSECGKCFADKTHLVIHQRTHTGEKPFSCSECGKHFKQKSYLIIHQRTHTGEKPYTCLECGKCFNRKSILIVHKRTHTGENLFHVQNMGNVPTILDPLSGDLQYKIIFMIDPSRMEKDRDKMVERILQLTLEILFRLTGEDYTVVKKTSSERCQDPVSEEWGRPLSPITGPPPHPLIHEDINDQKILELTCKMIELLTGEVPIRCQDVTVYFSMEEWEYLEGHKDLYKDAMMEVPQPLTSTVLSSERTAPERCPRPLLPQDCKQENPDVPHDHQVKNLTHINTTETYVRGDELCKEEFPTNNCPDDCTRRSEGQLRSAIFKSDDFDVKQEITEVKGIISDTPTSLRIKNLSSNLFKQVCSTNSSQTVKKNKSHKRGIENQTSVTAMKQFTSVEYGNRLSLKMSFVTDETFHTEKKRFSSSECGKYFNEKPELARHERVYAGDKPHSCSECGKCFGSKSSLVIHQRTHTGEKPYLCSGCGKCFADKSTLVRHQKLHTGEKPFSCSECGKCFVDKSTLAIHQRIHTGNKPYSCSECEKCFVDKSILIIHQRSHTGEKPHPCSECGKCFVDKSTLVRHQRIHTGKKPYSCLECGKCFADKSTLVIHQRIHTGEKPHSCSECGKCFADKSNLVKHEKRHRKEKTSLCSECGKCFADKAHLAIHQRTHTVGKPFFCSECGKHFKQKAYLIIHQRTHTGEKPYTCSECGKCFNRKSSLIVHKRTHTGENPCSECGKCFTHKLSPLEHQKYHTGEKPLSYIEGEKCFSCRSYIVEHQENLK
ncbi:LOW QUALITY PROTEIN: uncharacterized protein ACNLHF_021427 [Anomaloglossus baeobatrachus]